MQNQYIDMPLAAGLRFNIHQQGPLSRGREAMDLLVAPGAGKVHGPIMWWLHQPLCVRSGPFIINQY